MSMYGIVNGSNSYEKRLREILNLDNYDTGRDRDAYVRRNDEGTFIILLTRNGGYNRENYEYAFTSMRKHPQYVKDYDCEWDCTYAEICFNVPFEHAYEVSNMPTSQDPGEKFHETVEKCIIF